MKCPKNGEDCCTEQCALWVGESALWNGFVTSPAVVTLAHCGLVVEPGTRMESVVSMGNERFQRLFG